MQTFSQPSNLFNEIRSIHADLWYYVFLKMPDVPQPTFTDKELWSLVNVLIISVKGGYNGKRELRLKLGPYLSSKDAELKVWWDKYVCDHVLSP